MEKAAGKKSQKDYDKKKARFTEGAEGEGADGEARPNKLLSVTAEDAAAEMNKARKKEKRKAAFGWEVFNQSTMEKAYKKRWIQLDP